MINIFIFNNASRAANYGIGTYVMQLLEGLLVIPDIKVSLVEMNADTKEFSVILDDYGRTHYLIPPLNSQSENETYCRIIFYFLARKIEISDSDKLIFQFNYFQHYPLATLLKTWFPNSKIVLTVHYLNWCFELNGNVRRMREITAEGYKPINDKERQVESSFADERLFLHLADIILVLSKSTMKILSVDYKVSQDKMYLVYNGIANNVCNKKNFVNKSTRHILFVGRLDEIKGLKYLIGAFGQIAEKHPNTKLIIVGDGDFQPYMALSRKLLGRVAFFGKMQEEEVDEIYQSAYIGAIPSFHEQCSYTAIEMMRHGIPFIGTDSTGLREMLEATPELRAHINEENFNDDDFISQIASQLDLLLSDDTVYKRASDAVSRQFKERYTVAAMIRSLQKAVQVSFANAGQFVSPDYLPHIDKLMIRLINRRPDIDMDFYGLSGIGIYLWWRVLQLEMDSIADMNQIALIKEYLIYYLDWIEEVMENESLSSELFELLISMKEHLFYQTKVEKILEHEKTITINKNNYLLTEQEILHNALKICTCKI